MKVSHTVLLATGATAFWTSKPVQDQPLYGPNGYTHPTVAPEPNSTYEYIIVGSGAGGSPLAARLAQAGFSVLLIDAGEDHGADRQVQVPAMHPFASEYNPIRWDYFVERHDDEAQALRDTKYTWQTTSGDYWQRLNDTSAQPPAGATKKGLLYPRTGALGGCTVHNALLMVQATNKDWDDIAAMTGDSSWSSDNMRGYFKKLERNAYLQGGLLNSASHGFSGWLPTRLTPTTLIVQDLKITSLLIAAATATGKGLLGSLLGTVTGALQVLTLDVNTAASNRDTADLIYQMPLMMDENSIRTGPRDFVLSVANAKNSDGSRKYNLDIVLNTLVTKVDFDQSGSVPKATGVSYIHGKSLYRADPRSGSNGPVSGGQLFASREVIVSGGAFNTPQILKLSGVGPAEELAAHGIPLVKNLPGVGGNLQDRYEVPVVGEAPSKFSLLKGCTFLDPAGDACYDKWKSGAIAETKGAYTTNGIAWGYLKHSSTSGPDHDLWLGGSTAYFHGYFPGYSRYATAGGNNWSWLTLKAHSRNNAGSVNITSADPRDTPYINFRNFKVGGDEDLQALVEGMQYSISAFDKLVPLDGGFKRVWPDPKTVNTAAELRQFAKDEAWGHHASCTAPIGADSDPMAVLDSRFRVRGVDGLRVVDASAFPKIPGLFIALPTYTLSEKAADVIIADAQK